MRSHSGKDESRNNMRDPTVRDRSMGRDIKKDTSHAHTNEMGSHARKTGQKGDGAHR